MSVITFLGSEKIEKGQTVSMAAIATYLSLEQNYKILLINAKHNDTSLQECFWNFSKNNRPKSDLETGISGLIKAIASNKISPEIITNYTRTIFKDRLEILTDNKILTEDYERQKDYMKNIIRIANKHYDLVFIDIEGQMEDTYIENILKESNLVIINTSQRLKLVKEHVAKIKSSEILKKQNTMVLIGKYDKYSKYNLKNLQRTEKFQEIYGIPYNTLFFEACSEGYLADFIINYRRVKPTNVHAPIIEAISTISNKTINKLKELQMQA